MLTNVELAILGLVAERPKYGYQLEQEIEARGMRQWTEIGFSSIYYVLNKLEKAGQLESQPAFEPGAGGPSRKIYRLTEPGWAALRSAVLERLANPRRIGGDFELALANLPVLTPDETRAALASRRANLSEQIEQVRAKWAADQASALAGGSPLLPHVDALFDWSLTQMAAELKWIEQYLSNGGQDD